MTDLLERERCCSHDDEDHEILPQVPFTEVVVRICLRCDCIREEPKP